MESLEHKLRHAKLVSDAIAHFFSGKTWVVGGFLREFLLGNEPNDIDLATDVEPEKVLELDGQALENIRFLATPLSMEHGTILVRVSDVSTFAKSFEVTTLRKDVACDGRHATVEFSKDIEEDLARRDFTVNAMALSLNEKLSLENLMDPFEGRKDLESGLIKTVGNPSERFMEDHLRMLRACRFIAKLGWVEGHTGTAIIKFAHKCAELSKERIREELLKMMKLSDVKTALNCMWVWGLFPYTIPPLVICANVDGGQYHAETVLEHCIDACQFISKDKPLLRLAALLHDVGKPIVKREEGHVSFIDHENVGAEIVERYLKEFKFSNEEIEYVTMLVRSHMFHFDLSTHKKTIKKWLNKINGRWEDLILLRQADRAANKAKADLPLTTVYMQDLLDKIKEIEEFQEPMKVTDLEISGMDLIDMGLEPGPLFGKILNGLLEEVLEDPSLNEKEILLEKVREMLHETE